MGDWKLDWRKGTRYIGDGGIIPRSLTKFKNPGHDFSTMWKWPIGNIRRDLIHEIEEFRAWWVGEHV